MSSNSLCAVILNYNRRDDLIACIESLLRSDLKPQEIVVVDNASTDGSANAAERRFKGLRIIRSETNSGYAGGMNMGIREALKNSPDKIFILNSDTVVDRRCTTLLSDALQSNQTAAVASATIYYYPDCENIWYAGGTLQLWRASACSKATIQRAAAIEEVSFVSGCAMLIRSESLLKVGLFDERFFMYLEDTELCARFLAHDYKLLYVRDARIFHKISANVLLPLPLYFNVRNRLLLLKTSANPFQKIVGFAYLGVVFTLKLFYWLTKDVSLSRAVFFGFKDYLQGNYYVGRGLEFSLKARQTEQTP